MGERVTGGFEYDQRSLDERCLTEVDNLARLRRPDGTYDRAVLDGERVNLLTAVKEAAMPYAVSTTYQKYRKGEFWWIDRTPLQVARSGYAFHQHPAALERVDYEVAEARDVDQNLLPGRIKITISPKMTRNDAPYDIAKQEHLADDDMVRIHMLDMQYGQTAGKYMQSLLVGDVPLDAWVSWLNDPANMFGRSIGVEDNGSALPVMAAHSQLEVDEAQLPEGVVTIIEAVLPYIKDEATRAKVALRLASYRSNQQEMHETAEAIADRWLAFEISLEHSLRTGRATGDIERFVFQLQHEWGDDMLALLSRHRLADGGLRMTRELAVKVEQARQNTLWVSAAVVTGNEAVLAQLDETQAKQIYDNEQRIQDMMATGVSSRDIAAVEAHNNRMVAQSGAEAEGGCSGGAKGDFKRDKPDGSQRAGADNNEDPRDKQLKKEPGKESWRWKTGVCRVAVCPTRPKVTQVGPCEVCRCCQDIYDDGGSPFEVYGGQQPSERVMTVAEALTVLLQGKATAEAAEGERARFSLAA